MTDEILHWKAPNWGSGAQVGFKLAFNDGKRPIADIAHHEYAVAWWEKEGDVGRRQRSKLRSQVGGAPKGFSPERGRDYFVIALVVLPIMVGLSALTGATVSIPGAIAFVLGFAVVAGVVGMFTDNVGF